MPTDMTISRTGSFRYETTEPSKPCKGVCVTSSATKNKHVITASVDVHTQEYRTTACQVIRNGDDDHTPSLHCNHSPEYDNRHSHLLYDNRTKMMDTLKEILPPEHAQILNQLRFHARKKNDKN